MFDPFTSATSRACSIGSGGTNSEADIGGIAGCESFGYGTSSLLGSVILPNRADAAAVSGEHRKTESSSVPERPGKLRGVVRSEFRPIAGACPMPMQPLHPV